MMTKFLEKIGEGLAEKWLLSVLAPAFVFFGIGFIGYMSYYGDQVFVLFWNNLSQVKQIMFCVLALMVISGCALLVETIQDQVFWLMQGYWPRLFENLRYKLALKWNNRIKEKGFELQSLVDDVSPKGRRRFAKLDAELSYLPKTSQTMPTLIGNIVLGYEQYSSIRYGLEANVFWPRIYLLLPKDVKDEVSATRSKILENVRLLIWLVASLIWVIWLPWVILSVFIALVVYSRLLNSILLHGELIKSIFDLFRFDLYKKLCFSLPKTPKEEDEMGRILGEYIYRGNIPEDLTFSDGN